jgi:hypothetical protein
MLSMLASARTNVRFVPNVSLTYSTTLAQTAEEDSFLAPLGRLLTGRTVTSSGQTQRVPRLSIDELIWPRTGISQPNFGPFQLKNDEAGSYALSGAHGATGFAASVRGCLGLVRQVFR